MELLPGETEMARFCREPYGRGRLENLPPMRVEGGATAQVVAVDRGAANERCSQAEHLAIDGVDVDP